MVSMQVNRVGDTVTSCRAFLITWLLVFVFVKCETIADGDVSGESQMFTLNLPADTIELCKFPIFTWKEDFQ